MPHSKQELEFLFDVRRDFLFAGLRYPSKTWIFNQKERILPDTTGKWLFLLSSKITIEML